MSSFSFANFFKPKKIGLALGSGGDRGFAHIGVIKVLIEEGIKIDAVSGSSIGALVASIFALTGEINSLENFSLKFSNKELIKLLDINNPSVSLIKGEKIKSFLIDNFLGEKKFSDTKIPLSIIATSLKDGGQHVFREGRLIDAVMASCSIPGILPPVKLNNDYLVDGGLADAVPIVVLDLMGATHKIGVDLYSCGKFEGESKNMKEVLNRVYRLGISKLSALHYYQNKPNTLMLTPQTDEGISSLTFSKIKENILSGELEARKKIVLVRRLVS